MNGVFGGLLSIIDSIGGGFLYILIGGAASKPGALTHLARLVIGAVVLGAVISLIIYVNYPEAAFQKFAFQNGPIINDYAIPLGFVPPVAALLATAVLELLSLVITYQPKTREVRDLSITPAAKTEKTEKAAREVTDIKPAA